VTAAAPAACTADARSATVPACDNHLFSVLVGDQVCALLLFLPSAGLHWRTAFTYLTSVETRHRGRQHGGTAARCNDRLAPRHSTSRAAGGEPKQGGRGWRHQQALVAGSRSYEHRAVTHQSACVYLNICAKRRRKGLQTRADAYQRSLVGRLLRVARRWRVARALFNRAAQAALTRSQINTQGEKKGGVYQHAHAHPAPPPQRLRRRSRNANACAGGLRAYYALSPAGVR